MGDFRAESLCRAALFTDFYELTMAQAFQQEHFEQTASFEVFFRKRPDQRNFVLAAGLDDVLDYLEHWRFSESDLEYLAGLPGFSDGFIKFLGDIRFTGNVDAVPEGTPMFENEPLVRVTAPIIQAQILETVILNQIHVQTVLATKAARVVSAAQGRVVVDFGSRRAHGLDAAIKAARAGYLAGVAGTSNVQAGKIYGIPVFGTMAHSYIQAHDDERESFIRFASMYPNTTLLVDTYDTLAGVRKVIDLKKELGEEFLVRALRLDSGDLGTLASRTRELLDGAGLADVRIFLSGGLDEYSITRLLEAGTPVDGFGVGTRMTISSDSPELDVVYKLVEFDGQPRTKLSTGKILYPGRKQVFRRIENGRMAGDVIGRADERMDGQPLLVPVMEGGRRLPAGRVTLETARAWAREQLALLPEDLHKTEPSSFPYSVKFSDLLQRDLDEFRKDLEE